MLAHNRIVLVHLKLVGGLPRILLLHIEEAGVGGADHFDENGRRLSHNSRILLATGQRSAKAGKIRVFGLKSMSGA
jgi:hypothetical protein